MYAPFSLVRAALENACAAVWMLQPPRRADRLARRLRFAVTDIRNGEQVNQVIGQWHLLILEELVARSGKRESQLKYFWVPQAIAFGYYQLSWLLYVIRPTWSYRLNADFEDHAEHEYMEF